jgi:ribonuclease HII
MTAALRLATRRALAQLAPELVPDAVVLDGTFDFVSPPLVPQLFDADGGVEPAACADPPDGAPDASWAPPVHTVIGGDARCASVAAASVLAKVVRDRLMREQADDYPAYVFERNKGYPSPVHKMALRGYGPSAIHRRTWAFVQNLPWCGDPRRRRCATSSDDGGDLGEVTGDGMALTPVDQGWLFGRADSLGLPATGAEAAAGGR